MISHSVSAFIIIFLAAIVAGSHPSLKKASSGSHPKKDPCRLKPDPGPCEALIPKYFWDPVAKQCTLFYWGGCDGVVPFDTLEECENATCDPCEQIPETGPCKAYFIRYFFNQETKTCDTFVWGGCLGTVPFTSLTECIHARCHSH